MIIQTVLQKEGNCTKKLCTTISYSSHNHYPQLDQAIFTVSWYENAKKHSLPVVQFIREMG